MPHADPVCTGVCRAAERARGAAHVCRAHLRERHLGQHLSGVEGTEMGEGGGGACVRYARLAVWVVVVHKRLSRTGATNQ